VCLFFLVISQYFVVMYFRNCCMYLVITLMRFAERKTYILLINGF